MAMIFPGMDPYLEHPQLWPSVHSRLVVYMADQLGPLIRPRYATTIEERVYIEESDRNIIPDIWIKTNRAELPRGNAMAAVAEVDVGERVKVSTLEIHETYIEILDLYREQQVVAIIEIVSPSNKYVGEGRDCYLKKQREILHSGIHLVEIDLLRTGNHVLAVPEQVVRNRGRYEYLVSINRASGMREEYEFFLRRLRERLPKIPIPLAENDPEIPLDIQAAVEKVYEGGGYADRIQYQRPCFPALSPEDQAWADQLIREKLGSGQARA
jgi:hypothetical protein